MTSVAVSDIDPGSDMLLFSSRIAQAATALPQAVPGRTARRHARRQGQRGGNILRTCAIR
jgi:hypothetical protein